eukprot:TRINITY_DN3593_c0_g1_i4.p1 TRINITY_DN3593_c0_g1~~TRINITY_DN3593_c0_g1_i4.p1  ORF type:complete len:116 (+),score=54.17 TRINITY_DN3593_c0_g1_i4:38-385(+)
MIEVILYLFFFFQAEDGIRDAQESRGLGDVYKRQYQYSSTSMRLTKDVHPVKYLCLIPYPVTPLYVSQSVPVSCQFLITFETCLLYTSDAADDLLCVDLGGRRIIQKKIQTMIRT